ncbi:succinyl-CoA synthetase subunit beta [Marinobacter sp. ATCH36]|uniref:succinyl-CoA synthetase subunit beta n=1 Tax=Marinobacter sp. ATCH36 TaxID=2945106 RepID=UPI0020227CB2|nr:succinyl-CoA synthetase subunit beta [Marinobacter sp. ATCH36]MCL7943816.1 succinyl-CoA synthetase subunit beta [Marinobacter sp. ATCH36]
MGAHLPTDFPARKARIWQYLAFAGVILITPFFFIGGPGWTDGPLYKSAWNLGHILFFALLTLAIQPWRFWTGWALWGLSTLMVLALGLGIELLQYGVNRQVDWQDILRNLLGSWVALAARPLPPQVQHSRLTTWSLRIIVGALLVAQVGATAEVAVQQYKVSQLLPALYDFSQSDASPFWKGPIAAASGSTNNSTSGELEISLSTSRYSGVSLDNFPGDWREYNRLVIVLYNPQDHPLRMTLRINDLEHDLGDNAYNDRFNTRLVLPPGERSFQLDLDLIRNAPASRKMDMGSIRRLGLFASGLTEPKTVYLRVIRLE